MCDPFTYTITRLYEHTPVDVSICMVRHTLYFTSKIVSMLYCNPSTLSSISLLPDIFLWKYKPLSVNILFMQPRGSPLGVILPSEDIWQHVDTFLVVTTGGGGATGTQWAEARDTRQHPTVHRAAPTKGLSGPKYQQCQG